MRYFGRMMKLSLRDQTGVTLLILALNIVQVLLELEKPWRRKLCLRCWNFHYIG